MYRTFVKCKGVTLMNSQNIIFNATHYMKQCHKHDTSGHDVAHVQRVVKIALHIAEQEQQGDRLVIQLAALLHDTVDSKLTDVTDATVKLQQFLKQQKLSQSQQSEIMFIINNMSYNNGANNHVELPIEGQIVRDADRLDALGAIGIARTFQFAGHFNEPMWVESEANHPLLDVEIDKQDTPPSAIKHFYEKLFKLKSLMHTKTGKKMAEERHDYMKRFVTQFFNEWYF